MFKKIKSRLSSFPKLKRWSGKAGVYPECGHDQVPVTSELRTVSEDVTKQVNTQCHIDKQEHKERPRLPMTPTDVFVQFGDRLPYSDMEEIVSYSELWYLGKKIDGSNHDAEMTNRNTLHSHDHLAYRYEVLKMLGEGSYGKVYKCLDHKTNEMVAVKVVQNMKYYMQEVDILDYLRKKDRYGSHSIVFMKDYFVFREHLCIVYELLWTTLSQLRRRQRCSSAYLRCIAKDILKCLCLLEKEKIIHGDLKPGNIMLGKNGIKVIDFGGSTFEQKKWFPGIYTRYYSSPEVTMKYPSTTAADMWSLGCILAELHTGQYLFPGVDSNDQIALITEVLGRPPAEFFRNKRALNHFYDCNGRFKEIYNAKKKLIMPGSKDLQRILGTDDLLFLDFIQHCLCWRPEK
ncbi:hypothetical protein QTP70_030592, partial [Hemibagrus guttatus]